MELAKYEGDLTTLDIKSYGDLSVLTVAEGVQVPLFEAIPFWAQFVQPGSVKKNPKFKGKTGQFFFRAFESEDDDGDGADEIDEDNKFSETLRVLPIGLIGYRRILLPEYDSGITEPICQSGDGIWPSPYIDMPKAEKCGTWEHGDKGPYVKDICPIGMWKDGVKPECRKSQVWAFFDLDRKAPIGIELRGMNLSAMTSIKRKLQVLQWKAVTQGQDLKQYFVQIVGSDQGTYQQMQFSFAKAEDLDPAPFYSAVAWYQEHLLKALGTDPERPQAAGSTEGAAPEAQMSEEDQEALEKEQHEAVQDFEV